MSEHPSSPVGHNHQKPTGGPGKTHDNRKWIIGGVVVLFGIIFVAIRSANKNTAAQDTQTAGTPTGISPSSGYLYGSGADTSSLSGSTPSAAPAQSPVNITFNPPASSSTSSSSTIDGSTNTTVSTNSTNSSGNRPSTPKTNYYTVKPGDSLWKIAGSHGLGTNWQSIYSANKSVIGGNPNLIHPGQRLRIP